MNLTLKFSPEEILKFGETVKVLHGKMAISFNEINSQVRDMMNEWNGASAESYLEKIGILNLKTEKLLQMIALQGQKLVQLSGIYSGSEASAKQTAEALPIDGVFKT